VPRAAVNILLTGRPGCGKTTVVRQVIERLGGRRLAGFYTAEIRRRGRRMGFEAVGLGGASTVLAHVGFRTGMRVGRYGVELGGFDRLLRRELGRPAGDVDLFVIDEIGRMECCSRLFVDSVSSVLEGNVPVLATIASKGGGFIGEVRARPDAELLTVSSENRDRLPEELCRRLGPHPDPA
jgi:nucleoside-triphosphatase